MHSTDPVHHVTNIEVIFISFWINGFPCPLWCRVASLIVEVYLKWDGTEASVGLRDG